MKRVSVKLAFAGIYSALALISFLLENLLPSLILPGARIGVSNIFILLALISIGWQYAIVVLVVKSLLGSLFAGNFSAVLYSLPAGALALAFEILICLFTKKTSIVAVSICGSVINSLTQNTIFCLITKTTEYFAYLPYLSLIAILSGAIIGFVVYLVVKKFPSESEQIKDNI